MGVTADFYWMLLVYDQKVPSNLDTLPFFTLFFSHVCIWGFDVQHMLVKINLAWSINAEKDNASMLNSLDIQIVRVSIRPTFSSCISIKVIVVMCGSILRPSWLGMGSV